MLPVAEAPPVGDIFVTVTGNRDALGLDHPPGHAGLRQAATGAAEVRPGAVAYHRPGGGR